MQCTRKGCMSDHVVAQVTTYHGLGQPVTTEHLYFLHSMQYQAEQDARLEFYQVPDMKGSGKREEP